MKYSNRFYRDFSDTLRWQSFRVKVETTDLLIKAKSDLSDDVERITRKLRSEIRGHIKRQDCFLSALNPVDRYQEIPEIIEKMYLASEKANIGPMAAVAGAVAESVGESLLDLSEEIIVENGGDIYLKLVKPVIISIFAGDSAFSNKIGIKIYSQNTPLGICTSSGSVGHSLSFGRADAATIISKNTALADAVATGACNMIKSENDLSSAIEYAMNISEILGAIIIYRDKMAAKGEIEFVNYDNL